MKNAFLLTLLILSTVVYAQVRSEMDFSGNSVKFTDLGSQGVIISSQQNGVAGIAMYDPAGKKLWEKKVEFKKALSYAGCASPDGTTFYMLVQGKGKAKGSEEGYTICRITTANGEMEMKEHELDIKSNPISSYATNTAFYLVTSPQTWDFERKYTYTTDLLRFDRNTLDYTSTSAEMNIEYEKDKLFWELYKVDQAYNFEADKTNSDLLTNREDFFNGNISAMVTTITNPTTGEVLPQGMAYSYDQLNRLLSAKAFTNLDAVTNSWQSGSVYNNSYFNEFTYDANGNILTQKRHDQSGTAIEDMSYQYARNTSGAIVQNRLYHVNDNVAANVATDDIDDQGTFTQTNINSSNNYAYDGEGRLIRDDQEEIASIAWTVTGKVKSVTRIANSTRKNLKFRYDAMGMRVAKEIYDSNNNWEKTTYYVRDPQGNVMGIYEKTTDQQTQNLSYKIVERNIYGSSMVGLVKSEIELISASAPSATSFIHEIGEKQYYMANHLQSVSAVVSDMVIPKDCNNDNVVDFYRAQIISAVDFYSFGFAQAGRSFNSNDVRVGHNGKEKDDVMNVEGGSYDFGARMYDSRLGRFHSIDPAAKDLPYFSCYQFTNNSPALFIDPTGEKLVVAGTRGYRKSVQSQLRQLTDDKVRVRRNGEVVIKSRNPSPEKKVGTQLVRDIVDNTHTTTVQMSLEVGKNTTAPDDFDASTNGTGCNATVSFDPINLENVDMADGSSTPTPAFIALGHELSHARNIMQGDASGVKRKNPDGSVKIENGEPVINTTVEEIDAILTENKLRKENGIPERFLPLQRYEPIVTTIQKVEVVEPTLPAPPPKTPNNQNK